MARGACDPKSVLDVWRWMVCCHAVSGAKRNRSRMTPDALFKTIYQYNKEPVARADMDKLLEIAGDYARVKNEVYSRYSGINSLSKIYPGYTVQNEMTRSGLREQLGMPSVYFYLAVFDALGDIKSMWTHAKNRIEKNIRDNPGLTPQDRHYLRFVMKQSKCFESILKGEQVLLSGEWKERYEKVCGGVDADRLGQYLRRQVRRHIMQPHTDTADGFTVPPKGYRYGDHGIYLSMKEKRQRLFIPLTDNNRYEKQITVRLYPEEGNIRIGVPLEVKPKKRNEYQNETGLAVGMRSMFVTDTGNVYGEHFLEYQTALADYIRERVPRHRRYAQYNPGKKKYAAGKARLESALHAYINAEINRMLETEKPRVLYIPKLPATSKAGADRRINAVVAMWQKGYVKSRLVQKCRERSIEFHEVFGKGISNVCSGCGGAGKKTEGIFTCNTCGLQMPERENAAKNVLKRGKTETKQQGS